MAIKRYKSKLLLFGEYTVVIGSSALAIPCDLFSGTLKLKSDQNSFNPFSGVLPAMYSYLKDLENSGALIARLDLAKFQRDLDDRLFFESTIPVGYGVGSSGALCAAIYDRYGQKISSSADLAALKNELAQIEKFLHGSSSGIDPMVSLLDKPILIKAGGVPSVADHHVRVEPGFTLFLLDTGLKRKTAPLVSSFLEKVKEPSFRSLCTEILIPLIRKSIKSFQSGNQKELWSCLSLISEYQLKFFKEMIPEDFLAVWKTVLMGDTIRLKLLGAGGGGFLLGFSKERKGLQNLSKNYKIIKI